MTTHPAYRRDPLPSNTLTLKALLPLLPRLRCGACGGTIKLDPPTYWPGYLFCLACGRQYNAVVAELATRKPLTGEDARPRRGRARKARGSSPAVNAHRDAVRRYRATLTDEQLEHHRQMVRAWRARKKAVAS